MRHTIKMVTFALTVAFALGCAGCAKTKQVEEAAVAAATTVVDDVRDEGTAPVVAVEAQTEATADVAVAVLQDVPTVRTAFDRTLAGVQRVYALAVRAVGIVIGSNNN